MFLKKYYEQEELIQVSNKDEIECIIRKENARQFKLAYSLSLLEGDLYKELEILGEGKLLEDLF